MAAILVFHFNMTNTPQHFAIGDIHGYADLLEQLLKKLPIQAGDYLILLGDMVDRGPDSKGVIDLILSLRSKYQVIALKGNHEIMMLDARNNRDYLPSWLYYGGEQTLDSYQAFNFDDIPSEHWDFLESLLPYYETKHHIFAHANLAPSVPLPSQSNEDLHWQFLEENFTPHMSGKTLVCGHTAQWSGEPRIEEGLICIDTHVYGENGGLTAYHVEANTFYHVPTHS